MQGRNTLLWVLVLGSFKLYAAPDNEETKCRPSACVTTNVDAAGSTLTWTSYWQYDNKGRLIRDTAAFIEMVPGMPEYNIHHFAYSGDSVISYYTNDTTLIRLNKKGLPRHNILPFGTEYQAFENPDGTLHKLEYRWAYINRKGEKDYSIATIDNIVYANGNVVSYRAWENYAPHLTRTVTCTYYPNLYNDIETCPIDRVSGLGFLPYGQTGFLNVLLYSKNLVKTMQQRSSSLNYAYQYDEQNRLVEITRDLAYEDRQPSAHAIDTYELKYPCK